ncbi:MAG: hypothetical protein AB202_01180 [Parcubacteria bacterium C7867-007]|nr:MAG: hypothetical protein AB202_01180 [Parcubacteria bacterium C7867-007]
MEGVVQHDHWTEEHLARLDVHETFADAVTHGIEMLTELRKFGLVNQICGPMTTGGLGTLEANMDLFAYAVKMARERSYVTFNQIPFQKVIIRITDHHRGGPYNMGILTNFYGPLFQSGLVQQLLFLPGWESSTGACKEREFAQEYGIPVMEYPEPWLRTRAA